MNLAGVQRTEGTEKGFSAVRCATPRPRSGTLTYPRTGGETWGAPRESCKGGGANPATIVLRRLLCKRSGVAAGQSLP